MCINVFFFFLPAFFLIQIILTFIIECLLNEILVYMPHQPLSHIYSQSYFHLKNFIIRHYCVTTLLNASACKLEYTKKNVFCWY